MDEHNKVATKKHIIGVPIHDYSLKELIEHLDRQIINSGKLVVYGFSITTLGRLKEMPEFFSFWERADINVADGAGIPVMARLFGVRVREYVGLPNLVEELLRLANDRHYKVLLFGAKEEINKRANDNLRLKYENATFCSGIDGYFKRDDIDSIITRINADEPDILLIGISSPIKENFALLYKSRLKANIIIPCGGMIDVFAGITRREPRFVKGLPLTWIYRFIQEPKRLLRPVLFAGLRFIFCYFPILFFRHVTGIERNPSIGKFLKIQ